jgi:hypothetical protein
MGPNMSPEPDHNRNSILLWRNDDRVVASWIGIDQSFDNLILSGEQYIYCDSPRYCAQMPYPVSSTNHYHLLIETPHANLVAGMRWFQTWTFSFQSPPRAQWPSFARPIERGCGRSPSDRDRWTRTRTGRGTENQSNGRKVYA